MTNVLHESGQETQNGNGPACPESNLAIQTLVVSVSQISVNLLGTISFKVQHSQDKSNWLDVPSLATGNLNSTGTVTVTLNPLFAVLDYQRIVWTFNNANSVTFAAVILGLK